MKTPVCIVVLAIALFSCGKKPVADFSWYPAQPKVGETVSFINSSTDAKRYDWNLGNMKVSSEKDPKNVYEQAGNYIVDLTAGKGGKTATRSYTVIVLP